MKQYAMRNTVRTPVQCEFSCFADGAVINGRVWDLSATGWRDDGSAGTHRPREECLYDPA